MLKHFLIVITAAALLCVATPRAVGQEAGSSDQQSLAPEHGHARGQMNPAKRAAVFAKRLKLNSDQQSKVEGILKSEQSQMESLRSDSSLSKEDRRSKIMDIHKSSNDQIHALLDPDQQKKFDEMQTKHEERMQEHHQEPAPGGTRTSPQ